MVEYIEATSKDMEPLINIRLEMLKDVNKLPATYNFNDAFIDTSRRYFEDGKHMTILIKEDDSIIGCASMCYVNVMPTFDHPSGNRAHIMNVYIKKEYRGRGIAYHAMLELINGAKRKNITELTLDSTEEGRRLYKKCGFKDSKEGMVLVLK